jgi:hypothetical protein
MNVESHRVRRRVVLRTRLTIPVRFDSDVPPRLALPYLRRLRSGLVVDLVERRFLSWKVVHTIDRFSLVGATF